MRRKQRTQRTQSSKTACLGTIDANRLIEVRGGGIEIQIFGPTPFEMRMQHNETFVRLQA